MNRAQQYPWYVEVDDPRSPLLRGDRRKYVAWDPEGNPHLKLDRSGRCVALHGRLGVEVRCAIYAHRPRGCRTVQPGDEECVRSRRERGLDGPPPEGRPADG